MKKHLHILFFCLVTVASTAQTTWSPAGAEWFYHWTSQSSEGYVDYRYTKDTVLANRACHLIEDFDYGALHTGIPPFYIYDTTQHPNLYTYSNGDTVYFYYSMFSKWLPVYFFNAQVGDTLTIPNYAMHTNSDSTVAALVDSAGIMMVDTQHLRYYCFHIIDSVSWCNFTGKAVEKLGMMDNDIIPFWHCITDDYYYSFCSYQDNVTPLYPTGAVCRFITGIPATAPATPTFSLFPNPATNTVTITTGEDLINSTVTVSDVTGRTVGKFEIVNPKSEINTTGCANGIYFVTIAGTGKHTTKKLIIQK